MFALCCANRAHRACVDVQDDMWIELQGAELERVCKARRVQTAQQQRRASQGRNPGVGSSTFSLRASKRLKISGKQAFFRAVRARHQRSALLLVQVTSDLSARRLTLARLRKYMRALEPVDLDQRDASGFTLLNLVTSFGDFAGQNAVLRELLTGGAAAMIGADS